MPPQSWNGLRLLLLTAPPEPGEEPALSNDLDAVVLDSPSPSVSVAALAGARPDLPLIVIADVTERRAAELVAQGAHAVLPRIAAGMSAVLQAVQTARPAARQMRPSDTATPPRASDTEPVPASSSPSAMVSGPLAAPPSESASAPPSLAIVGRLAGGVAQNYADLLHVIEGEADRLAARLPHGDPLRQCAQAITAAGQRAAVLTQQLLAFGRQQRLLATPVNMSTLVVESEGRLRADLADTVALSLHVTQGLPSVLVDRVQLATILRSLVAHAGTGMPEGGTVSVTTGLCEVDEAMRASRPWLALGRFVRLTVTDTGPGLDPEALPHLFEPFFDPQEHGAGPGLGLAAVYGIVKQSGGFIWVDSELGRGTAITMLFRPSAWPPADRAPAAGEAAPARSGARILLVEDDDDLRELLRTTLSHSGFEVHPVASAEAALGLEPDQDFDLLLTDVVLPGRSGPDLVRAVRAMAPGLPVILMSGDGGRVAVDADLQSGAGVLRKPFTVVELLETVREAARHVVRPAERGADGGALDPMPTPGVAAGPHVRASTPAFPLVTDDGDDETLPAGALDTVAVDTRDALSASGPHVESVLPASDTAGLPPAGESWQALGRTERELELLDAIRDRLRQAVLSATGPARARLESTLHKATVRHTALRRARAAQARDAVLALRELTTRDESQAAASPAGTAPVLDVAAPRAASGDVASGDLASGGLAAQHARQLSAHAARETSLREEVARLETARRTLADRVRALTVRLGACETARDAARRALLVEQQRHVLALERAVVEAETRAGAAQADERAQLARLTLEVAQLQSLTDGYERRLAGLADEHRRDRDRLLHALDRAGADRERLLETLAEQRLELDSLEAFARQASPLVAAGRMARQVAQEIAERLLHVNARAKRLVADTASPGQLEQEIRTLRADLLSAHLVVGQLLPGPVPPGATAPPAAGGRHGD
ncbi:MAG: response regulator [Vicinamibacterales bacterium]